MANATVPFDFNDIADWDHYAQDGPANKAPTYLRDLLVISLRAEWLDLSFPEAMTYSKNHMVFAAKLKEPTMIGNKLYYAARLSMEINYDAGPQFKVEGVSDALVCGEDYAPGIYTLSMRNYPGATRNAPHYITYNLREGTTIGKLIDEILTRKMDRFLFFVYTDERNRFKGCGHHILRVFTVYVDEGIIISENSEEGGSKSFADELVYTYVKENGETQKAYARVGRGRFLEWDDKEHDLFEDQMWSAAPPLHQEKLATA